MLNTSHGQRNKTRQVYKFLNPLIIAMCDHSNFGTHYDHVDVKIFFLIIEMFHNSRFETHHVVVNSVTITTTYWKMQ